MAGLSGRASTSRPESVTAERTLRRMTSGGARSSMGPATEALDFDIFAGGTVPGQLQVLALVLPHRHPVRLVDEDVSRLQDRVVEVAGRQGPLAAGLGLGLELGHAAQLADGRQVV